MTNEMDLKLENMKQLHEVDKWKWEHEFEKYKQKGEKSKDEIKPGDIALGLGILFAGGIAVTAIDKFNVLNNNPEQQWFWERLSKPKPPMVLEAVHVERQDGEEEQVPPQNLNPHFSRELRPKYLFSGTTGDPASKFAEAQRQAIKEKYKPLPPKPSKHVSRKTPAGGLRYGSGGGQGYSSEELAAMDRRAKENMYVRGA